MPKVFRVKADIYRCFPGFKPESTVIEAEIEGDYFFFTGALYGS